MFWGGGRGWTGVDGGGGVGERVVPTTGCYGFVIPLRIDLTHSVMSNNPERFVVTVTKASGGLFFWYWIN